MKAHIYPSGNVLRIKYADDSELKAILDALAELPLDVKVNGYRR